MAHGLEEKPELVVLSRADVATPEQLKSAKAKLKRRSGNAPLVISAATGQGIEALLDSCIELVGGSAVRPKRRPIRAGAGREPSAKRSTVSGHRRIVVKVGSSLLVDGATGKLNAALACLARRRHRRPRRRRTRQVLVVSSGAIALGRRALGAEERAR